MSYTLEFYYMDGNNEQDPDFSTVFPSKDQLIGFLSSVVLSGSHEGRIVEHLNIINDRTDNHIY